MKHILVPTDFSENAYHALIYATRLFEKTPCTIHILHSIEEEASLLISRIDIGRSEWMMDKLYDEADAQCEAVKARVIKDTQDYGHTFDVISTAMSLPRAMNRICAQREVDLVIMGTKGRTAAREIIMGSNTIQVLKKIKSIPVLVIPLQAEFEPIQKIAFATSFKKAYHTTDLDELIFLARLHNSEIKILHVHEDEPVSDTQRENLDSLIAHLTDIQCNVEWIGGNVEKTRAITDYVKERNIDLFAIIYYKYNFIVQLFRESVVKKIGRHPKIPYLVIPAS